MKDIYIVFIIVLAIIGFFLASYIYNKKKNKKKLVCPINSNCEQVVNSTYSKVMGMPVEVMGIVYYAFTILAYSLILVLGIEAKSILLALFYLSIGSVLFSIYLIGIQIIVIKQWCIWCLSSAFISILIFVFAYLHLILS